MTPEQAIKIEAFRQLLADAEANPIDGYTYPESVDESNIDDAWNDFHDATDDDSDCWLQGILNEIRTSGVRTGIPSKEYSRHYERHDVAALLGGRWVGWTYWYGGGKHGEPEAIEWLSEAYFVDVEEETRTIVVRTFTSQATGQVGKPVPML